MLANTSLQASGSVGSFILDELLKAGKHNITVITRTESKAVMPAGVKVVRVNYDDHSSLVEALRDQEVLIITMSVHAPPDSQIKLIDAAGEAGVSWIMPNSWGVNTDKRPIADDIFLGPAGRAVRKHIQDVGKSSWVALVSSFWYEFSLGGSEDRYGFDFKERSVVFFDDGRQPINTTTWPQTGLAVARLLALPVEPEEGGDKRACLSHFKNRFVYVSSFCISQKDMFESVLRVTDTKPEDWKIRYEDSKERYEGAVKEIHGGSRRGFSKYLSNSNFFLSVLAYLLMYRTLYFGISVRFQDW